MFDSPFIYYLDVLEIEESYQYKMHLFLIQLTVILLVTFDRVSILRAFHLVDRNFSEHENICSLAWYRLETTLDVPTISLKDYKLGVRKDICTDKTFSCCTKPVEDVLKAVSKTDYNDILVKQNIAILKSEFIDYSSKFDRK